MDFVNRKLHDMLVVAVAGAEANGRDVAGGLSVALARSFPLIDPNVRNPQTWQWERAFQLFDLLL